MTIEHKHFLNELKAGVQAMKGTRWGFAMHEAHKRLAAFTGTIADAGRRKALAAFDALENLGYRWVDEDHTMHAGTDPVEVSRWQPKAEQSHFCVIYTQGYDNTGKRVVFGVRSSEHVQRDHRIMDAAIDLYYAGNVRKQDNITPEILWKNIMDLPMPRAEYSLVDAIETLNSYRREGFIWTISAA